MTDPYYEDEHVTLYHGDCLELADVWTCADVMLTDPPYGRGWKQGTVKGHATNIIAKEGISNDHSTEARDNMLALWGNKPAILFGDLMLAPPADTKLVCVYQKPLDAGFRGSIGGVRRDAEAIYLNSAFKGGLGGRSSIFQTSVNMVGGDQGIVRQPGGHPHSKPTDVLIQLMQLIPDGVIADPFAGGGSTLVAAKLASRKAIGVELDERWCEVAAKRLSQGVLDFGDWKP